METNRVLDLINKFTPETDKLKHFFWGTVGAVIGLDLYYIFGYLFLIYAPITLIAIVKELFIDDEPSFWDFFYTIIMAVILTLVILNSL